MWVTKSALDSLFGAIKLMLRRRARVVTVEELCVAMEVATCVPHVPDFILDWRSKCEDLKVNIPHIKSMFYFEVTKHGVSCRAEVVGGDLSAPQDMFPGLTSLPFASVKHVKPIAPQPNRSKGLRLAFVHMNAEERAFWYRVGYAQFVAKPKKTDTKPVRPKKASGKGKYKPPGSQRSSQKSSSPILVTSPSQVPLSQQSEQSQPSSQRTQGDHEAVNVVEYESDDESLICHV